jgi:transposase
VGGVHPDDCSTVPDADIVHDKFHASKYLGDAVDQVRSQEHKKLMAQGDEPLKGSRQLWLYIPQHFSPDPAQEFSALKALHLKVARAWAAKELFSKFWAHQQEGWARRFFKDWFGWGEPPPPADDRGGATAQAAPAQLADLPETAHRQRRTEGLNLKIQSLKSAARGFRNFQNYRARILCFCGKLDLYPL